MYDDLFSETTAPYWAGLAAFLVLGYFPTLIADAFIFVISWCSDVVSSLSNGFKRTLLNILTFVIMLLSLILFMVDFSPIQAKLEHWKETYTEDTLDVPHTLTGSVSRRFSRAMAISPPSPSMMRL